MVEHHQVSADELAQMRARLDGFEAQYGMPSHRMLEVPEFSDENNMLEDADDLMVWSSLFDRYELLTAPEPQQSLLEADEQRRTELRQIRALRDAQIYAREGEDPDLAPRYSSFTFEGRQEMTPEQWAEWQAFRDEHRRLRPGTKGALSHLAHLDHPAAGEELPPRPWMWQRVHPKTDSERPVPEDILGEVLVAADGTWLLWAEDGWARPEFASPAVKAALADGGD